MDRGPLITDYAPWTLVIMPQEVSPIPVEMKRRGNVRLNLVEASRVYLYNPQITKHSPFRYFKTSLEIICLAVMLYVRFPLSLRNVEYS